MLKKKKKSIRATAAAPWIKCLLHKHKECDLHLRAHVKTTGHSQNLKSGRQRQDDPGIHCQSVQPNQ